MISYVHFEFLPNIFLPTIVTLVFIFVQIIGNNFEVLEIYVASGKCLKNNKVMCVIFENKVPMKREEKGIHVNVVLLKKSICT